MRHLMNLVGDKPLWTLIALFWVWEAWAHFVAHNHGQHTLSDDVGRFEKWSGPAGMALVALLCLILAVHLLLEAWSLWVRSRMSRMSRHGARLWGLFRWSCVGCPCVLQAGG